MRNWSIPKEIVVTSIMILLQGSVLLVGFLYVIFGLNLGSNFIFNIFIGPIAIILGIGSLVISIPLFGACYGLVLKEEWSRRIAIKFSLIGITITFLHTLFFTFVLNDQKIMIIPFSIATACGIVAIYLFYRPNVKAYFSSLKSLEYERDNQVDNSLSLLSSDTITFYLKIFLIAEISTILIIAFVSLIEAATSLSILSGYNIPFYIKILLISEIMNQVQPADPVINTIKELSELSVHIVSAGVTVFLIWWFSRTYTIIKGLGISGLSYSNKRIILSFVIPGINFYEPVRLIKKLWKASEPNALIIGISWKEVATPTGFGVWWFFVLASWVTQGLTVSEDLLPLKRLFIDPLFVSIANLSTIVIVRRINSRIDRKRELLGELLYWNPLEKVRIQHPANWDRYIKNNTITFYPSKEKDLNKYSQDIRISIEDEDDPNANIDWYVNNTIKEYNDLFADFVTIKVNTNTLFAGHRAYQIEYQYRLGNRIIKNLEVGIIVDHKVYRIEYEAESGRFPIYIETVRKMIDSFELKIHQ